MEQHVLGAESQKLRAKSRQQIESGGRPGLGLNPPQLAGNSMNAEPELFRALQLKRRFFFPPVVLLFRFQTK